MKTATINGIAMAYYDVGAGQPLLLIHAFPLSSAMWDRQIAALAEEHRVIAPDLRGFGASAPGDSATSMDQYADDLAGLLEHLGLERVAVAGLSMGGYISFAFLRRHPTHVSALILANTRAGPDGEEAKQGREKNARLAEEQGPGAIADQMLPKLLSPSASDELRAEVRRIIEANDRRGIAAALRAMAARPDSTALLPTIDVPTLVIVGGEDTLTPPSEAQAMHAAIPGSRLLEIPGVAHLSNIEAPQAFNTAVAQLLKPTMTWGKGGKSQGTW